MNDKGIFGEKASKLILSLQENSESNKKEEKNTSSKESRRVMRKVKTRKKSKFEDRKSKYNEKCVKRNVCA